MKGVVLLLAEDDRRMLIEEIVSATILALKNEGLVVTSKSAQIDEDAWGSRKDACELLSCSLPTLHNFMNSGAVVYQKVCRKTLINLTDLREKLKSGRLAKYSRN